MHAERRTAGRCDAFFDARHKASNAVRLPRNPLAAALSVFPVSARNLIFQFLLLIPMRRPLLLALLAACCAVSAAPDAQAAPQWLDDEAELAADVDFTLQSAPTGAFSLLFDAQNPANGYLLSATPTGASFSTLKNGQKQRLSSANFNWKPRSQVILQRRAWMMRLIVDNRVVLSAFDSTFASGKIGAENTVPNGAWKWSEARVQPVEAIRFDDDFTREGGAGEDAWTPRSGTWELSASSSHVNARTASMSSNPFAYEVSAAKKPAKTSDKTPDKNPVSAPLMASAGRKFWDSYDARVAARPSGRGTIGIAAYVQDPRNYLAFTWSGVEGAAARRLIRVQNGVTTILASAPGAFLPRSWSQIGIRTSPGAVEALIDGTPVLRATDNSFGRGAIALLSQNLETASFDDVRVRSLEFYRQNRATPNGAWTQNGDFALTGRPDMDNYQLIAAPQNAALNEPSRVFGLVAGWRDAANYTLFRVADAASREPFRGRGQIVRVVNGKAQTLFDAQVLPPDSRARLTLSAVNGVMTVRRDNQILAQAAAPDLTRGRAGLWKSAQFAPETVLYFASPPEAPKVAARMEDDAYMVGWASATGEWPPTPGDNGLEFWNTSEFFGAASLEVPWRAGYKGSFEVALRAQRGKFESGQILRGESSDNQKTVKWTLRRGNSVLATAVAPLVPAPAKSGAGGDVLADATLFKVALDGGATTLFANGAPVLSYLEKPAPVAKQLAPGAPTTQDGYCLAVRSQGFRVRADRLRAWSANRDDTTFTGAPVDFYSTGGTWSIFSRWPCYGDWSFFGGAGRAPVLWSKRTYGGDMVAEMYAHPQMILPKEPGYGHPGDLNISLAGDGKTPASGYSFVVAGWDNTRSRLLRGTQVLAENHGEDAVFQDTTNTNSKWHRKWFYIRAEARRAVQGGVRGVLLTLTLDDNEILRAFDPKPLPNWEKGGRVAFWTLDSTLMIARAKVEAQRLGAKSLPAGLLDATPRPLLATSAPQPVLSGDDASAVVSALKSGGWKIQNPQSGGVFEVQLGEKLREITPQTRLEIDAAIPQNVHIDAYIRQGDALSTLEMSGAQTPDAMALSLGQMKRVGDKWSFDLGAALQKRAPNQKTWKIDALSLGARQGDAYRHAGFGGNALGASYQLSGWRLVN